jgi:hypothetical protein
MDYHRMTHMGNPFGPFICGKVGWTLFGLGMIGTYLGDRVPSMVAQTDIPAPPHSRTLVEWMPWLIAGGFMLIATQVAKACYVGITSGIDLYVTSRKKIRDADSETVQFKLKALEEKCEALCKQHESQINELNARHQMELSLEIEHCKGQIRNLEKDIHHQTDEIASCYARLQQRDMQIKAHIEEKTKILENNLLLIDRLSEITREQTKTNIRLTDSMIDIKKTPFPPEIKVAPGSEPIPVVQAEQPISVVRVEEPEG